jgi:serine/threonine-protein kinase
MSLRAGSRLGPYEITAPIGAGGMGEVYRAHDSRLHREVAIKTLPPAFADDPNRLARFQREAQALAALSHPNIAAIYGLEESGGVSALIMELVEGPTLEERIKDGPIPIAEALAIARQIGAALEAAHEKGIVHRDLKPANIKLTGEGQVKVLDFGLAKALDTEAISGSAAPANSPTLTLDSTRAGVILGTAAYMSPEQARGKPVDKRADIWSFGVVFFEMLTGRSTFEGETVSDTLAGVLRADIDWKHLPADTPPALRRLLERCLQRDPKRRLRDIGDAWIEIDAPVESAAPVVAVPPAKASPVPWIACGAAVLVALAAVAWAFLHKPAALSGPVVRWSYSQQKPFTALALSHDGSHLAYMEVPGNTYQVSLRAMDQIEAKALPELSVGALPVFSPDGRWMAFLSIGAPAKLQKVAITGGTPISLCEFAGNAYGLAWGDDGNIVFTGPKGLMRVSSAGGTPQQITTVDSKSNEVAHRWPNVLPGSRAILFSIAKPASSQIAVLDAAKHTTRVLMENASTPRYVATGHLIYYRSGALFAAPFDPNRLQITGSEAPVVEHVAGVVADGADYSVSDGGMLAYMFGSGSLGSGDTVLNWADRKGTMLPLSEARSWGTGRLSPDMTHVANGIHSGEGQDIWTYDLVRRTPTRLTFDGKGADPIWSPDGKWITYVDAAPGKTGLYRVASDASGKQEFLAPADANAAPNSWSPDGKTLVFSQPGEDKKVHLWALTIPGGKPVRLHQNDAGELNGEVSPDGHWIAYESSESGNKDVYVQPFPAAGAKTRISTDGGSVPRWAHSGKEIFFWRFTTDAQLFSVDVQPGAEFHAGVPQPLFKAFAGTTWDVAADGRLLVETPASATGSERHMEVVVNWFSELTSRVPVKK